MNILIVSLVTWASNIICKSQCKMKMWGLLFKNLREDVVESTKMQSVPFLPCLLCHFVMMFIRYVICSQQREIWNWNYLLFIFYGAMTVLNANISTFSSYIESPKLYSSYFRRSYKHLYFLFNRTVEIVHKMNSTVFISLHVITLPILSTLGL